MNVVPWWRARPAVSTTATSDTATRSPPVRHRSATWRGDAPTVSWLFDNLAYLASARRLFVVVDAIEPHETSTGDGADWGSLLGGLAHLVDTTTASIARVSDNLVDVVVRRGADTYHSFATSAEARTLLEKMQARLDATTIYIGDGTHASLLERSVGAGDLTLTTSRPCGSDRTIALADLDNARPIVEMLYLLRRGAEPHAHATSRI
jgi:hypothetical protein